MTTTKQAVESAVSDLVREFETRPADFNKEASLRSRLRFLLEDKLETNRTRVVKTNLDLDNLPGTEVERVVHTIENADTIPRVIEEAGFGKDWGDTEGNTEALDIAVLPPEAHFYMDRSSKWYNHKEVEAAIELKFVKEKTKATQKEDDIQSDINRLKEFNNPENGPSAECYMLVFAVRDLFSHEDKETHRELRELKSQWENETPSTFRFITTPLD